jgi:hypothetical protein
MNPEALKLQDAPGRSSVLGRATNDEGRGGSWVHAYLHRKEGDQDNAAYWYSRAGKPLCREPLDAEWISIVKGLLG